MATESETPAEASQDQATPPTMDMQQQDYHHQYPSCPYLNGQYYCPRPYYNPTPPAAAPEATPMETQPPAAPVDEKNSDVNEGSQPTPPAAAETPAEATPADKEEPSPEQPATPPLSICSRTTIISIRVVRT